MNILIRCSLVLALICCNFSVMADEIDVLLDISGTEKQVLSIRDVMIQQLDSDPQTKNMSADQLESIKNILVESYSGPHILAAIKRSLKAGLSELEVRELNKFYDQETLRKMTKLEEFSSTPEGLIEMQAYSQKLSSHPPTKERLTLIQNLDQLVSGTDLNLFIVSSSLDAVIVVSDVLLPAEKKLSDGNKQKIKEQLYGQIAPVMSQVTLISYLFTYRDISHAELSEYASHYEKPLFKKFSKSLKDGYFEGFKLCNQRLKNNLITSFKNNIKK